MKTGETSLGVLVVRFVIKEEMLKDSYGYSKVINQATFVGMLVIEMSRDVFVRHCK